MSFLRCFALHAARSCYLRLSLRAHRRRCGRTQAPELELCVIGHAHGAAPTPRCKGSAAAVGWSMVIGVSDDGQDGMADHQGQDVVQHGISWALAVSQRNVVTRAWIHRPLTNKSLTQEPALKPFHTYLYRAVRGPALPDSPGKLGVSRGR